MLKHNRSSKITGIIILAAVVAALTTVAVIFLRMRMRKKAGVCYGDSIDYDLDDCCCCCGEEDEDTYHEEPVQIPLADEEPDELQDDEAVEPEDTL